MGTLCRALSIFMVGTFLTSSLSYAQSGQYQRPSKKPKVEPAPAPSASGATAPAAASAQTNAEPQKVDISDLEKKYWVPKDTEFHVVQNRTYSKAKRFAFTGYLGSLLNDPYSKATITSFSANYYFTERQGVELNYMFLDSQNTDLTNNFQTTYAAVPNHNKYRWAAGAAYNWVPIYAKLSLLEQKIIYFDMSISPGIALISYDHQYIDKASEHQTAIAPSLDIAQHFFMSKNFALRADVKGLFFNEEVVNARVPYQSMTTKLSTVYTFLIGVTYYP